jgi:hypothetical protein
MRPKLSNRRVGTAGALWTNASGSRGESAMKNDQGVEEILNLQNEIATKLEEININKAELDTLSEMHREGVLKISARLREDLAKLRDLHQRLGFKLDLLDQRN